MTQTLHIRQPEGHEAVGPDLGVIRDARRRRRRERASVALLALTAIGLGLLLWGPTGSARIPATKTRPTPLVGAPLSRATHLRLLVSENGGPAKLVDVASGRVQAVAGLGLPRVHGLWSPMLWPLIKVPAGALGIVTHRSCDRCAGSQTHFLIGSDGSVRRLSTFRLAPDQFTTTPVRGSTSATWLLTHAAHGHCTLRASPGSHPAVPVPCGDLVSDEPGAGADTAAGLLIATPSRMLLVNPHTGSVRERSPLNGHLDVLDRRLVLISGPTGTQGPGGSVPPLTLVNLADGAEKQLRWPSRLQFGYEVLPDPRSALAAIEFGDPAYHSTAAQVSDVWLLDTRTGVFHHVPGFPIFEHLKFSGMAWTGDHRLVIVAQGRRTVIGIWRPGDRQIQVGKVPALDGYSELVPLAG